MTILPRRPLTELRVQIIWKNRNFRQIYPFISEMIRDRARVAVEKQIGNPSSQMVPVSMILSDLERLSEIFNDTKHSAVFPRHELPVWLPFRVEPGASAKLRFHASVPVLCLRFYLQQNLFLTNTARHTKPLPRSIAWCCHLGNLTALLFWKFHYDSLTVSRKAANIQTWLHTLKLRFYANYTTVRSPCSRIKLLTNPHKIARKRFMVFSSTIGSRE